MIDLRGVKIYYRNQEVKAGYLGTYQFYGEDPLPWVLATDVDFSGTVDGEFRYIGNDPYVEIPHVIKGVNITSYARMFQETGVIGVKSTSNNIANMESMFRSSSATSLDLSNFDTSKVTTMHAMFYNSSATSLDLSGWDTSSVTGMSWMFYNSSTTGLDLSSFTLRQGISLSWWSLSSKVTKLDVSNMDFVKYARGTTDMLRGVNLDVGYALNQENANWLNARIAGEPFVVKPKEVI